MNYKNETAPAGPPAQIKIGDKVIDVRSTRRRRGADGAAKERAFTQDADRGHPTRRAIRPRPTRPRSTCRWSIAILTILVIYVTMVYGPIAAMLVELFPTRIRYTSMSLPYHIGNGWFGGFLPPTAFAIVAATGDIYSGLWYPIVIAAMTFVIGTAVRAGDQGRATSTRTTERSVRAKTSRRPREGRRFLCPIVIAGAAEDLAAAAFQDPTMNLDAIAIGHNPPEDVNAIIEVPIGGEPIKYEMDKAAGTLVVDRFLYTPMRYPGNYGFVPHTLSDDGDPIDVLVANTRPHHPRRGDQRAADRRAEDGGRGGGDEKIIAVPSPTLTQRYVNVKTYTDLPEITRPPDRALLRPLQGPRARQMGEAAGLGRRREAQRLIAEAIERAKRK